MFAAAGEGDPGGLVAVDSADGVDAG